MSPILYSVKNVPGTWQWWADASAGSIWLAPENAAAQAYATEHAMADLGYIRVGKADITPVGANEPPTIF